MAAVAVLPSVFAICVLIARAVVTGRVGFTFLMWNLFLAWVPVWMALTAEMLRVRPGGRGWHLLPPLAMWLLFLPNAPYILTDVVHVLRPAGFVFWYELVLVFAFALAGLAAGVASMRIVQRTVTAVAAPMLGSTLASLLGHLVMVGSAMLSGVGIYVGRVLRWNSWDVFIQPHVLLPQMIHAVANPWRSRYAIVFSILFGVLFTVIFVATAPRRALADARAT